MTGSSGTVRTSLSDDFRQSSAAGWSPRRGRSEGPSYIRQSFPPTRQRSRPVCAPGWHSAIGITADCSISRVVSVESQRPAGRSRRGRRFWAVRDAGRSLLFLRITTASPVFPPSGAWSSAFHGLSWCARQAGGLQRPATVYAALKRSPIWPSRRHITPRSRPAVGAGCLTASSMIWPGEP